MGLSNNTENLSITAKLTPYGRQELLKGSSSVIVNFALGDTEANYNATLPLTAGEMPDLSGNEGVNTNTNNSTSSNYKPKSILYVDVNGNKTKTVKDGSSNIITTEETIGYDTVNGPQLTFDIVNKDNYETDSRVNWFSGFKLPITKADDNLFTGTTSANGGYSDTAFSAIAQSEILVVGIPAAEYGETLDGKTIKLDISGSSNYTLYSTYQATLTSNDVLDATYNETTFNATIFGENVAFLFSDDIQPPNDNLAYSWSTKYGTTKAFKNGKDKFNYKDDSNTNKVADKIVGIAYLDKGLIVVTDPTIVASLAGDISGISADTSVRFNSVTTQVTQEITCIADRGEFASSMNPTWNEGDTVRISEVMLLDTNDNIMAVGRPNKHIEKTAQQFLALGIKLTV